MINQEHSYEYDNKYHNADLAPIQGAARKWHLSDFVVLWISIAANIATYMGGSMLIAEGMNWLQAVITVFLANTFVLIPLLLNSHVGVKYGISYPIYCRAAFGIRGANIPALLRAIVACGWCGIVIWIGANALYKILLVFFPQFSHLPNYLWGINFAQFCCFVFFSLIHALVITKGMELIRILLKIKAPILIVSAISLAIWAYTAAKGFGPIFSKPSEFIATGKKAGQFWSFFFPAFTALVGGWATLALNIPDFTRYSASQKSQTIGQIVGLPLTMVAATFIGIFVTSASAIIYGNPIWDPVELTARFSNPIIVIISMVVICIASLATNLAANIVSPANDFSHLWPKKISFKLGGYLTIIVGALLRPWKILADPSSFIFKWLIAYAGLLGAIAGILIVDYYVFRKTKLNLSHLYQRNKSYWYHKGFNPIAIVALICGIAPCIPGFLGTIGIVQVPQIWLRLYDYAWFLSFAVSFIIYFIAQKYLGNQSND